MKIHAHILAWNEEVIIPFTLNYYTDFCEKVFVYDNCSTDATYDICKKYSNVEIVKWKGDNGMNDATQSKLKSEMYRQKSRNQCVDWVIVIDCDEFLYDPNLLNKLELLKTKKIDIPRVIGYDMVSEKLPQQEQSILDQIKTGYQNPFLNKCIVFNPDKDIQYGIGAHTIVAPDCVFSEDFELILLHYKFISLEYVLERYTTLKNRQSMFNKAQEFNTHYTEQNAIDRFNELLEKSSTII